MYVLIMKGLLRALCHLLELLFFSKIFIPNLILLRRNLCFAYDSQLIEGEMFALGK